MPNRRGNGNGNGNGRGNGNGNGRGNQAKFRADNGRGNGRGNNNNNGNGNQGGKGQLKCSNCGKNKNKGEFHPKQLDKASPVCNKCYGNPNNDKKPSVPQFAPQFPAAAHPDAIPMMVGDAEPFVHGVNHFGAAPVMQKAAIEAAIAPLRENVAQIAQALKRNAASPGSPGGGAAKGKISDEEYEKAERERERKVEEEKYKKEKMFRFNNILVMTDDTQGKLKELFDRLDVDKSGYLDKKDINALEESIWAQNLSGSARQKKKAAMMDIVNALKLEAFDKDQDNTIDFSEFCAAFKAFVFKQCNLRWTESAGKSAAMTTLVVLQGLGMQMNNEIQTRIEYAADYLANAEKDL